MAKTLAREVINTLVVMDALMKKLPSHVISTADFNLNKKLSYAAQKFTLEVNLKKMVKAEKDAGSWGNEAQLVAHLNQGWQTFCRVSMPPKGLVQLINFIDD